MDRTEDAPANAAEGARGGRALAIAAGALLVLGAGVALPLVLLDGAPEEARGGSPGEAAGDEAAEDPPVRLERGPTAPASEEVTPTSGLPTAGTVDMPGGAAQRDYEATLRALSAALSAEGLRPRDVRSSPRGAQAWAAQAQAARTQRYEEAARQLGEVRAEANSRTAREWMVYRLQAVERRLGDPPPRAMGPRLRALWGSLDASASSPSGVRRFMRRVDALEGQAR
jgi:hypothetical protein